jgi:hypothetical protein
MQKQLDSGAAKRRFRTGSLKIKPDRTDGLRSRKVHA